MGFTLLYYLAWNCTKPKNQFNARALKSLFHRNSSVAIVCEQKIAMDANNKNHGLELALNPGFWRGKQGFYHKDMPVIETVSEGGGGGTPYAGVI